MDGLDIILDLNQKPKKQWLVPQKSQVLYGGKRVGRKWPLEMWRLRTYLLLAIFAYK